MNTLTWLHLSDLHYCEPKTGWDAQEILEKLSDDLRHMEQEFGLAPDLIFFTGDLAFGEVKNEPGWSLDDQYGGVNDFLETIRKAFKKEVPRDNIFIVPGNHDVNRKLVTESMTQYLDLAKDEKKITTMIKDANQEWDDYVRRLKNYRQFLETYGYAHLLTDPARLVYALKRAINNKVVGIGGFNSAWSCSRLSNEEKGKLWMGTKWQMGEIKRGLKGADFSIALIHHPPNWFVEKEDKTFATKLQENFTFCLHGHEHSEWVLELANGHSTISASACYESSDGKNGYNFVHLDFDKGEAQVWLREYSAKGEGGWIACQVPHKTDSSGLWRLDNTKWMTNNKKKTIRHDIKPPSSPVVLGPEPSELRKSYLNRVVQRTCSLNLKGIDRKTASRGDEECLNLEAVYTALLTQSVERDMLRPERQALEIMAKKESRVSALALLDRHDHLVLLGEPGSGKSTFVNFASLCLAGEVLKKKEANLKLLTRPLPNDEGEDEEERQPWNHGALVPVRVILRDFAARGLPDKGVPTSAADLWHFIEDELQKAELGDFAPHLRKELIDKGGLVLLDGLDEVPEADERRHQIKQAVEDFAAVFHNCRILVTSRTYAYQEQNWRLNNFTEAVLAPFSSGQIRRFVDQWYAHLAAIHMMEPDNAQGGAELLKRAIFGSSRLQDLAERPLLLTLMASLHAWGGGSLPERREELYSDAVDLLLKWWENRKIIRDGAGKVVMIQPGLAEWLKIDREQVRSLLNELAFKAHKRQPHIVGTADIPGNELVNGLMTLNLNPDLRHYRLIEFLSQRAGLLVPRGVNVYTFPHRTFQEYLAACYLTDHPDYPYEAADLARQEPERWREVLLLAGAKSARGSKAAVWSLAEALCDSEPDTSQTLKEDTWGAHLAAQALVETIDVTQINPRNKKKFERIKRWLIHIMSKSDLPALERASAGRTLAKLGDPRPEVMTIDEMQFCLVPGGDFIMGDEEEEHCNSFLTEAYWIGRFPITNAQYGFFVEAGGYKEKRFWVEAEKESVWTEGKVKGRYWDTVPRDKPYDHGLPFTLPNHPVVGIMLYEALAFTRWLTEKWQKGNKCIRQLHNADNF